MKLLQDSLLKEYLLNFAPSVKPNFEQLEDSDLSIDTFSFYISVSAVFSSKIEGEDMDLDSFIKHKRFGVKYQPDHTQKIDDLYNAYWFAQENKLHPATILKAHAKLTKHILRPEQQGKFRTGNMFVVADDGKIEYVAASPGKVVAEMEKWQEDMEYLLHTSLSFEEIFFYASMLHLTFIKIHPFNDGNGRTARLLEKWFLAEKLGGKAWLIPSERFYYDHHSAYYHHIRKLGLEYDELNYPAALPFLQMLPAAIIDN